MFHLLIQFTNAHFFYEIPKQYVMYIKILILKYIIRQFTMKIVKKYKKIIKTFFLINYPE